MSRGEARALVEGLRLMYAEEPVELSHVEELMADGIDPLEEEHFLDLLIEETQQQQ
jgi:hypothetical protein